MRFSVQPNSSPTIGVGVCPFSLMVGLTLLAVPVASYSQSEAQKAEDKARATAVEASNRLYQIQLQLSGQLLKTMQGAGDMNSPQAKNRAKLIEKYRQQGYSQEEIKIMLDPSTGMNGLMDRLATQLK